MKVKKLSRESTPRLQEELALALANVRALEAEIAIALRGMEEKVRQLEFLSHFSSLLNSSLDPGIVREKALEATCQLLSCETASLLLKDSKTNELYWDVGLGETGQELKKTLRLPIDEQSLAGFVAKHGEPILLNDVERDPRYYRKATEKTKFKTLTMLCVPLRIKGEVIGVLQAINKMASIPLKTSQHAWPEFYLEDLKLFESLSHQVAIAFENSKLYHSLKKSFYETVEAMAESIEKKDSYTGGHTKRVVYFSLCIAKYLDISIEQKEQIELGALLHDIGKIGVDDGILRKSSELTTEEWKKMQKHPEIGFDIMSRVEGLKEVTSGMRYHHERWDGKGYPLGLKGEEIPFIARVIAVADAYDAMVSSRPYRKGMPNKQAFDEIVSNKGIQFDPKVIEAFVQAFQTEKMGKGSGGSTLTNGD